MLDMEFLSESDFNSKEIIGAGNATVIFKAKHWPTGRSMRVKNVGTSFLDEINKRDIIFELDVLNRMNFPHLLRYYGAYPRY
ncbi:dual specificity mitogen-activated protein kinase kinase 1-like [Nilaparvata lugens]|uniref:dual specificity mitogen-activated protein kinase kinase 1-like n=1 Tax=Nilaparvata lugens TaxID=108931 RepID=UPI00193CE2C7|nr:dual specificity mitogen-activated protein kinase kinase 1-like [Nilaparvata lugens]